MADCFVADSLRQGVLKWLQQAVPESRLQHSLRVETMALKLALHHGLPVESAQSAGLMHDLAKCFPPHKLLAIAKLEGWRLDATEFECPHLLHAAVGAVMARNTFGIRDKQVLDAIANHTLGSPDMDAISSVVYLADPLESGRGDTPELNHLRELSYRDREVAVYETCVFSLKHLLENKRSIHPHTILTYNRFLSARLPRKPVSSIA